ncbi:histidine kinase internal region [Flavobacteriales bacterium ALC-1]|nr:histidine kinase internal region [Flavobacteriales bacterium ALC-1]
MKKLFVHLPLFRLLSPLFSGVLVYLLLLLINNNVEQLQEQFLGEELYVCIGLSFLIQEVSRLLLLLFKKLPQRLPFILALLIQVVASLIVCISVVTLAIYIYYKYVSGYSPNSEELWNFNSIFAAITFIYILLNLSHHYLYKVNTKKLNDELLRKQLVEEDFIQFKNEINPTLLFDSLESIIVLAKQDKEEVDDLIDTIASTYRYVLSKGKRQLVLIEEELQAVEHLVKLFDFLPYRKLNFKGTINSSFLVVPGSLLKLVETIVKTSIVQEKPMAINLVEGDTFLGIEYKHNDKISEQFNIDSITELQSVYSIYSEEPISIFDQEEIRFIKIPKLQVKA